MSDSNLIFVKSVLFWPASPTFIVLIKCLISFQSSMHFVNISLLLSVEAKTKYLSPLLSSFYPSALSIIRYKGFTLWIFSQSPMFLLWCIECNEYEGFCMTLCLFLVSSSQSFRIDYVITKVISSIFNVSLLDISHLYI